MRNSQFYCKKLSELSQFFSALPDKPEETLESTLDVLCNLAAENRLDVEIAQQTPLPELNKAQLSKLSDIVHKRVSGTPLAHLTGKKRFMNIDFEVSADALIPRKETELVGYAALDILQDTAVGKNSVLVVDICTGVGNLGLALAHHEPKARVFGADLSAIAVALAVRNTVKLNLCDRVEFFAGDLLEPFRSVEFLGKVDVLTCNPPYISAGKLKSMPNEIIDHEPAMAFDGGPFGISILSRLIKEAPEFVRPGGWLAFEVGEGQGPGIQRMLHKNPKYDEIRTVADGEDRIRAILALVV